MFQSPARVARIFMAATAGVFALAACGSSAIEVSDSVAATMPAEELPAAASSSPAKALKKVGLLDCPADGLVASSTYEVEAGGFDRPGAPKTPEAAFEQNREKLRNSTHTSERRLAELPYKKTTTQSDGPSKVHFLGQREDGTVESVISVAQGGKSKSWIPVAQEACAPLPPSATPTPGAAGVDDGEGPVLHEGGDDLLPEGPSGQ